MWCIVLSYTIVWILYCVYNTKLTHSPFDLFPSRTIPIPPVFPCVFSTKRKYTNSWTASVPEVPFWILREQQIASGGEDVTICYYSYSLFSSSSYRCTILCSILCYVVLCCVVLLLLDHHNQECPMWSRVKDRYDAHRGQWRRLDWIGGFIRILFTGHRNSIT